MSITKIYNYLIFVSIITLSCNGDILDTIPNDRLSQAMFWRTKEDAIFASNGVYSVLGDQWRYTSMDAYTDIAHFILQWRGESLVEKNTFDSSNKVFASEWEYYYKLIGASCTFLENIERVKGIEDDLKKRLVAEIKTLRAFAYINLTMLYGDVPLVKTTLSIEDAKSVNRTPQVAVWDFIAEELTSAATDLPMVQEDKGRVTQSVALGLKARAMLYAGRYAEARSASKAVIDMGVNKIFDSYSKLFDYEGEKSSEIMFARQYTKNLDAHSIFSTFTPNSLITKSCQIAPTKPLIDAYLMKSTGLPIENSTSGFDPKDPYKDRDPRLYHTVYITGDILPDGKKLNTLPGSGTGDDITTSAENVTPTGWYFKKYLSNADLKDPNNCGVNLIYLRYAEVLLTYAEASVEIGGTTIDQSVLDAINEIRRRADVNMPKVTTMNQDELRQIIRRERMVELAMEGHRLFDIRRWKIAEEVTPGSVKGMTYEDPKAPGTFITVELKGYIKEFKPEKHYLWPIPLQEVKLNKNLEQNIGY